jgi:hypothetical protein
VPIYCLRLTQHRRGLAFFGTPHAGGNDTLVSFGRSCAAIVNTVMRSAPNDLMEAVSSGSLYTDILQESWRHQLNDYRIISFYEGSGNVSCAIFYDILPPKAYSLYRLFRVSLLSSICLEMSRRRSE